MADVIYLADKSALVRLHNPEIADRVEGLARRNRLATCSMIDLELLYSARNADEYELMRDSRAGYRPLPMTQDTFGQALAIQRSLAEVGKHRRPIPDLLIAAVAILNNVTVLHYDKDFDMIAEVCELYHEWIVPPGTV